MSRIPSKAMPHAFAEGDAPNDVGDGASEGDRPTIGERAGAVVDMVKGSRTAQLVAGAVVAGAVAAGATAVVRNRRGGGETKGKSSKSRAKA